MSLNFRFAGEVPASKSELIRALVLRSYEPGVRISGDSSCDDVLHTRRAIDDLMSGQCEIDCGEGGLVLRLLLTRVSRIPGEFILRASPRLLERPHGSLISALEKLGVEIRSSRTGAIEVRGQGWRKPSGPIAVDASTSSQFASSLLLNAWSLDFPLELDLQGSLVSEGYWEMSLAMARELGMQIEISGSRVRIPAAQKLRAVLLRAESDLSSTFAVAALAAVAGSAEIQNFPWESRQPDLRFVEALERMTVSVERANGALRVRRAEALRPIEFDLGPSPDLFPVLSVLCAFAPGRSRFFGAAHLRHKESDRIEEVAALLEKMGRKITRRPDGLEIEGRVSSCDGFDFDPNRDHRMVMAAAVARWAGVPVRIHHVDAVAKSFPEFLKIAGLTR